MFIKRFLIIGFATLALIALVGCTNTATITTAVPNIQIEADDHIYGDPDAPITLIEYSDFECPYCKTFHTTARRLVDNSNGRLNWVFRQFPLSGHDPLATNEALATECAADVGGNDKFWEFADKIYGETKSDGRSLDANLFPDYAEELGINKEAFKECLDSKKFAGKIKNSIQSGKDNGVSGTPGSFLLNNATGEFKYVSGAQPYEALESIINSM